MQGKDVGRSVAAWGFWADILNSPYHCFGTACDDASYYRVSNKQFMRTGYDVAEYNVMVRELWAALVRVHGVRGTSCCMHQRAAMSQRAHGCMS